MNTISKPVRITLFILTMFALAGCAPKGRVAATWRGALVDEKRINENIELQRPRLKTVDWENQIGAIHISLEQYRTTTFDLQKHYEEFQAIRKYTNDSVPYFPFFGGGLKETAAAERRAIERLKAGETSATAPYYGVDEKWQVRATRMEYTQYTREHANEYAEEILKDQRVNDVIPVANVLVRITNQMEQGEAETVRTNESGRATLAIANRPSEALTLTPTSYAIAAKWEDEWLNLGSFELTEPIIATIHEALQEKSLVSEGVPSLPPFADVAAQFSETEITAGRDCEVLLTVMNAGKGEFYRLVATAESLVPSLDGLRFEFGKLDPNDRLTLTKKVHIPRGQPTGPVNMSFKWSELNGYEPDPVHARLMIRGLPRPVFAMSVQVLDDNSGNSVGNGDGRIQKGEAVDLLVTVKNTGDGIARETSVRLEGIETEGVIVNVAEQDLGEIAVGETKQARLTVTTKKAASISRLTPTIYVVDKYLDVEQKEQLTLALESELPPSIMAYDSKAYVADDEIAVRGGAGNETAVIARAKAGSVLKTTGELGEWIRVELPRVGTGWVYRSEISFEPTAQTVTSTQSETSGIIEILEKAAPLIVLAKPHNNSSFLVSKIEVSGVIADNQAVQRVVYRVNGKEITSDGKRAIGVEAVDQGSMQREVNFGFTAHLTLGDNEIEITAWDNEGLQSQKVISVTYEKEKGNVYIACIGIDKYKNVPQLKYAAADAREMAALLQQRLGVPEENVYLLLNEEATLGNIKSLLGVKIRQQANKADTVIIYFSGHGAPEADSHSPDADGVTKYLLPIDAEKESLYSTALPMDEVRNIFRRLVSERVIFIADTCYSGAAGGRTLMPGGTQYRSINQDNLLTRLRDTGKGRVILTASQGSEVSQEKDELGHGVFTYYLLRGLDGKADANGDQTITVSELYEYVSKEVPKATKNTQHPMMKLDEMVGEVIIAVLE